MGNIFLTNQIVYIIFTAINFSDSLLKCLIKNIRHYEMAEIHSPSCLK